MKAIMILNVVISRPAFPFQPKGKRKNRAELQIHDFQYIN
jgi:hypothetical protein